MALPVNQQYKERESLAERRNQGKEGKGKGGGAHLCVCRFGRRWQTGTAAPSGSGTSSPRSGSGPAAGHVALGKQGAQGRPLDQ